MNDTIIVTSFVIIDDVMKSYGHTDHVLAQASDAEVLTVAVVAALYFHNHHERAVVMMNRLGYLSGRLSVSRFNRRLHQLSDWLNGLGEIIGQLLRGGQLYLIDSLPVPVCKWVRGRACGKVRGRLFYGKCGAKGENFFGWRLHLVFTPDGFPVAFDLLPARCHDLTPIYQLLTDLPNGARVLGDKGYNSKADQACLLAEWGIHLIARRRSNMHPLPWPDDFDLRRYRLRIESFNSQLVNMGIQRLHARTRAGFDLKIQASLLALTFQHFD